MKTIIWIVAAVVGGALSVAGFVVLLRRVRRREIRWRYLVACGVGYTAFVSFALLSALRPSAVNSAVTLIMLLPGLVAIVLVVREHQKTNTADR